MAIKDRLYIKNICTAKNLTAKTLAKTSLFSVEDLSFEALSDLFGKQVWLCNPKHSLLA